MFIPLIQKRRSIRRFLKKPVEPEKIELLIEAALRAPSSRGLNPWEFIVVSDRELLKKLAKAKIHGSAFLKNASLAIIICADPEKCDVWIEDASIASIFVHLASESIGLGSCWIQIRERMHNDTVTSEEYVSEILNMPGNMKVESIVAIGYAAEKKHPHTKEALHYEKVHNNLFGGAFK